MEEEKNCRLIRRRRLVYFCNCFDVSSDLKTRKNSYVFSFCEKRLVIISVIIHGARSNVFIS